MKSGEKIEKVFPKESTYEDTHTMTWGEKVYDVYKLIEKANSLPAERIPLDSLRDNKDNNYWHDTNGEYLGPHHILAVTETYEGEPDWEKIIERHPEWEKHILKIKEADYKKHLILLVGEDGVLDGMHRLTRAWIDKPAEIKIKRFAELPEDAVYLKETK